MFFMHFRALKPIVPTWRFKTKYIILNKTPLMHKYRCVIASCSGRNFTGKRILNTKCSSIKVKVPTIRFNIVKDPRFFVSHTRLHSKSTRVYNVWQGSYGNVNILPAVQGSVIGMKIMVEKLRGLLANFGKNRAWVSWPILLGDVPFFYKISNIFFKHEFKPKYTTAGGTLSIKLQAEKKEKCIKVKLVSGAIKFFSKLSYCLIGQNYQTNRHNHIIGKAGNNINIGKNKLVRGVAMNPVDHPNGGRTKSCSPELSPWGWVAKLNK